MKLVIHPRQGIQIPNKGLIPFGLPRQRVREFFTSQPEELQHGEDTFVDLYSEIPLRFSYDETQRFCYLDIFYEPDCSLILNSFDLFSASFGKVKKILEEFAQEPMVENETGMWTSEMLSITLHHQLDEDEWFSEPVDSICLFAPT